MQPVLPHHLGERAKERERDDVGLLSQAEVVQPDHPLSDDLDG